MKSMDACPTTQYRAWLIDLDGTLYRAPGVRLAMATELLLGNWRTMAILRAFRHEHESLRQHVNDDGESPYHCQIRRTAERLKRPVEEIEGLVCEWMHRRPGKWIRTFRRRGLLQEIERFRAAGGRTALVSDYPATLKLDALGIRSLFEVVVASGEPGGPYRLKPCPDGYLMAAQRLEIPPGECLVLGDRSDADGEAAFRAGMGFRKIN